ncbi:Cobyric acid synthase [Paraglaciecola mesophila]|uniref:Cobyric acid synthase n=1 Tax=Paraglaciecola mesophila TaxID=197222 RepID=A0A857JH36_9ALTE|nr:cobyric acid synthase [Paraglaciecola mesophila]QHJ11349.1 Cobyric acid synthase [Paraglaciecola mesophila]
MTHKTATIMIQGTTSDAGKSMLVAGFCRCLKNHGWNVAPFKPQNMALNSAVTKDGGEIGRAQAVQAQAAGIEPSVHMNPVLLKPSSDTGAQVIIQGKAVSDMQAKKYHDYKQVAMQAVLSSHKVLCADYEVIVVEGAGSPAEINLRKGDIANMGFAEAVDCPVIIVADIDRGGVFAQLVGTLDLLAESEQKRVVGFVINKFRGDIKLLEPGLTWLEQRTKKPVLGVLPYIHNLQLAAEDAIQAEQNLDEENIRIHICVPVFKRISNHTDFDMLRVHPQVKLTFVAQHSPIPPCDLIILPGSKNVRADLALLKDMHWDKALQRHLRYGGKVLGICGGYQMLGHAIADPQGVEDTPGTSTGLGYLPINTELRPQKQLTHSQGNLLLTSGEPVPIHGYEIHIGTSTRAENANPLILLNNGKYEGCISDDNQVAGSYLHGLFDSPQALQHLLAWAGASTELAEDYSAQQEQEIARLAHVCQTHLNWDAINTIIHHQFTAPTPSGATTDSKAGVQTHV